MQVRVPSAVRAGDDADASLDLIDDDLEHARPLRLFEPCDLAGHAQRSDAVDAGVDEQIDDTPQARFIEVAVVEKWSWQNGIDAFELQ